LGRKRKKKRKCHRYQRIAANCRRNKSSVYPFAQGLDSAPDVPHAADSSGRKTEGSGVGFLKEPPVSVKGTTEISVGVGNSAAVKSCRQGVVADNGVSKLRFCVHFDGQEMYWDTLMIGKTLFVEMPSNVLPDGSRESFVSLLEYAEDVLSCSKVIICFKKNRADQASLIRTFKFLGFVLLAPGTHQLAVSGDLMYLAYSIDPIEASSSEDDSDESD